MCFDIVSIVAFVVFALGFKMSSVYISENCLAVTHYEHPIFPSLVISHDGLVGCKLLLTGCPRGAERWGPGEVPGRDNLLSASAIPQGRVRPK